MIINKAIHNVLFIAIACKDVDFSNSLTLFYMFYTLFHRPEIEPGPRGLCSYYRKFVPGFAVLARPLSGLTKKNRRFEWGKYQQLSFDALKRALISPPMLVHPRYDLLMEIHCDASGFGVGAILVQQHDGKECALAYASRHLD